MTDTSAGKVRIAILGASGYTGAELVRLLLHHPHADIRALTADRKVGQTLDQVFPHLAGHDLPVLVGLDEVNWKNIDVAFGCLPHGQMHGLVRDLPKRIKVIDLSADFRLTDPAVYAKWYGLEHSAVDLQAEAVYGIPELHRAKIAKARIVAGPGCYPTSVQIPLSPLLSAGLIEPDDIVIDSKSGVSGAGRSLREGSLFCEVSEGFHAYGIGGHRHAPEMAQGLSWAAGGPVSMSFTPHLLPMNRGILSTMHVRLAKAESAEILREHLASTYAKEPFVRVLAVGASPATRHVRGSNFCHVNAFDSGIKGRAIVISVIDNLVKGASGQLVQCMNLMCGFPESAGLEQEALFP